MTSEHQLQSRFVKLSCGSEVHTLDTGGSLPPALFVHGIATNATLWEKVIAACADQRRCVAIDLMGHGRTTSPMGVRFNLPAVAQFVLRVADALDFETFDLVANDSGGGACQILAATNGHRLNSFTLTNCDTHDNWPMPAVQPLRDLAAGHALGEAARAMLDDPSLARITGGFGEGYSDPANLTDDRVRSFVEPFAKEPERCDVIREWLVDGDNRETTSVDRLLERVTVPTQIVWGEDDPFFGPEWADWLAAKIPGCVGPPTLVEGGRLFFPDETPEPLVARLRSLWT